VTLVPRLAITSSVAAVALAACAVIRPIGDLPPDRIDVDWALPLYDLEAFAYHPLELGQPLFVQSAATPPGGMVVVPSRDREVRGVDAQSGKVLWSLTTSGANIAQPVAVGEELVVASTDGHVYRANQRNGRAIWTSEYPGKSVIAAPAVAADRVFVTSIDNRLTALAWETGERLWDKKRPHASEFTMTGQAGAVIHKDSVITGFSDGQLIAFAAQDGATLWSTDLANGKTEFVDVDTTPVVVGDLVVASSYRQGLYGVDAGSGTVTWLLKGEGYGTPATMEGILYVPQASGRIVAVRAADGAVRWVAKVFSERARTPGVTHKYVVAPIGESLALIDRGSGRTVARYDDARGVDATPEMAYGTAFVLGNSGTLYALGIY
jgi:outer membrane protein assembly factor BamB